MNVKNISKEDLEAVINKNLSATQCCEELNICMSTLKRKCRDFCIQRPAIRGVAPNKTTPEASKMVTRE